MGLYISLVRKVATREREGARQQERKSYLLYRSSFSYMYKVRTRLIGTSKIIKYFSRVKRNNIYKIISKTARYYCYMIIRIYKI